MSHRKLDCSLSDLVSFLRPLKSQIKSMAVESTFNWYWLVDGLREGQESMNFENCRQPVASVGQVSQHD